MVNPSENNVMVITKLMKSSLFEKMMKFSGVVAGFVN
jgi:hypothetical protein